MKNSISYALQQKAQEILNHNPDLVFNKLIASTIVNHPYNSKCTCDYCVLTKQKIDLKKKISRISRAIDFCEGDYNVMDVITIKETVRKINHFRDVLIQEALKAL